MGGCVGDGEGCVGGVEGGLDWGEGAGNRTLPGVGVVGMSSVPTG